VNASLPAPQSPASIPKTVLPMQKSTFESLLCRIFEQGRAAELRELRQQAPKTNFIAQMRQV
jgi:hypothetical protein